MKEFVRITSESPNLRECRDEPADAIAFVVRTNKRRNLSPDAFKLALGRRYNRTKQKHGGDRKSSDQNDNLKPKGKSHELLAVEHSVSPATVIRAGKFAEEVEEIVEGVKLLGGNPTADQAKEASRSARAIPRCWRCGKRR